MGDSFFIFGGWDPEQAGTGGVILDDVWRLDLNSLQWEQIGTMPRGPTSRHVAAAVQTSEGPRVLLHTFRCLDQLIVFDPSSQTFSEKPCVGAPPSSRGLHASIRNAEVAQNKRACAGAQ